MDLKHYHVIETHKGETKKIETFSEIHLDYAKGFLQGYVRAVVRRSPISIGMYSIFHWYGKNEEFELKLVDDDGNIVE